MSDFTFNQLEARLNQVRDRHIRIATGYGRGNAGATASFVLDTPLNGRNTLQALCLTSCPPGSVQLYQSENGQWYAVGANFSAPVNTQVSQLRRHRPELTEIKPIYLTHCQNGAWWKEIHNSSDEKILADSREASFDEAVLSNFLPLDQRRTVTVQISYETSTNCGGHNPNTQSGGMLLALPHFLGGKVVFTAKGLVETHNPGFEFIQISKFPLPFAYSQNRLQHLLKDYKKFDLSKDKDGELIVQEASTESGGRCNMAEKTIPEKIVNLPRGNHLLKIDSSTQDGLYHVGAFWQINLSIRNN